MVTAPEASVLLAMACARDHRKPDQWTVKAWAEDLDDVDFNDAQEAIRTHYRSSSDWLDAAQIRRTVRAMEAERIAAGPNLDDVEPPEWLTQMEDGPEFTAAYLGWYQEQKRRLRRGLPLDVGPEPVAVPRQWKQLVP